MIKIAASSNLWLDLAENGEKRREPYEGEGNGVGRREI